MVRRSVLTRRLVVFLVIGLAGCHTTPGPQSATLPALSMIDAIRVSDANTARISGTIRASGSVDGHFTHEGRRRSYQLDGVLFFLAPDFVRFDLKKLGDRQLLFGSNDERFWIYSKQEKDYACWNRGDAERIPDEMPIRPDQIIDALGLRLIGDMRATADADIVQRVVDDAQQILVMVRDESGQLILEREYWLDRYAPRLVRRVVFRDAEGNVELASDLTHYRAIEPGGPMLPYEMAADWPGSEARMRFRVDKWSLVPQVSSTGPQFATPKECGP